MSERLATVGRKELPFNINTICIKSFSLRPGFVEISIDTFGYLLCITYLVLSK